MAYSLDEQAEKVGSATSSAQLSAPNAAQGIVIQEAQHLSRELGGRNQGIEPKMPGSAVEKFYEDASRGAQFTSPLPSERVSTQSSSTTSPSLRVPSNSQNANTIVSSSSWLPDPPSFKQNGRSTSPSSPSQLGPGLLQLDLNFKAPNPSKNSPVRKLPQIPSSHSTQLNNNSLVSSLASNSTSKMTPVSAADSEISPTPISALSATEVQQTTGNSGGISTSIGTGVGDHTGAQSGPVASLMVDAGKNIVQIAPSSTSSSSSPSTSMLVTSGSGPSTALTKTSNSPTQPVGILKNKHARHPSGSSLSVSMRLPAFQSSAASSSGINFASALSITQHTTSSSSSSSPPASTSYLTPTSSTTPFSTTSPQSTTTVSSVSVFAFSPHPGSATSSVATSPTSSPLVTENAGMTYPSIHSNLDIDTNPSPSAIKTKGKQREVYHPDDFTSPTRPLPLTQPAGLDTRETHRSGFSGGSVATIGSATTTGSPRSSTSTSTGTASLHGSGPSLAQSVFQGTSSSSTITSPLRPALRSSFSSSSLSSRNTGSSSAKGKLSRPINPTKFGPPPSSSSNSNNTPSTSSAKSPIPSSWASRPVDLNSQRPPNPVTQHGFTSSITSHSRSSSQSRTQITSSQQSRARVSSSAGTTSNLTSVVTSVPVLAYGNRSRSGSGSMGVVSGSGTIRMGGSRNVVGGRARSHSRTRTRVGVVGVGNIQLGGTSGGSRAGSREREVGGGDTSLKSMSVPSTPVMKSMQTAFLASSSASGGSGLSGTSTSTATPLSSRPPRLLPSPILPSKTLSNFASSSREASPARPIPRRLPTFDQIVISSGLGPAQSIHTKSSSLVGPLRPRETSLTRHVAATSSRNTSPSPRRLPQPSLAAHIASISALPPPPSRDASSVPTSNLASIPIFHPSSARDGQSTMVSAAEHLSVPNITTTSASPISPAGESPLHSHPLMDQLLPRDENDDDGDKSSLSSFRAAPPSHVGSDVEAISNQFDGPNDIIADDERFSIREVFDHRDLSRSPSPIRYALPEDSEGLFSSSEDEDLRMPRRGRRGRERGTRPLMTKAVGGVTDSDAGPSESGDGFESDEGMKRGRRMQPRSFRHSYRSAPIVSEVESSVEGGLKGSVEGGDVEGLKGGDRLWRISRAKTKTKAKDGDLEGVVKAKNKAKKAKTKRSYFDFDFDYLPNFKDRERETGSRTTSSVGTSSRGTTGQDDKLNIRPSSPDTLDAALSRGTRLEGEATALEETLISQRSDSMRNVQEPGTIFDISSSRSDTKTATAATFDDASLHVGSTTTTTESSPSFSSHSPHITSQSGPSDHSPYTSRSNVDMTDVIHDKQQYALATSSPSSVPASPSTRPSAPFLSHRSDQLPASPHPERMDFQQNSAYALEMEMHGITCGLGSGPSMRRGSQSRSAQSSQANSRDYGEHSSSLRGHASTTSTSNTSARNSSKVPTPFSVFGLSRRESSMFREKNKGNSGGVKLKEKSKKGLRSTGTSSTGSSRKTSSLTSFLSDDDPLKNDTGGAGS
ncbi:hypothetical protein BJ165DRAFT_1530312 [Panaeolus papilionaceus]|nr:hypothetical protein BJ165DRAFT_1530312 [Panaeolus papilionaceus]